MRENLESVHFPMSRTLEKKTIQVFVIENEKFILIAENFHRKWRKLTSKTNI